MASNLVLAYAVNHIVPPDLPFLWAVALHQVRRLSQLAAKHLDATQVLSRASRSTLASIDTGPATNLVHSPPHGDVLVHMRPLNPKVSKLFTALTTMARRNANSHQFPSVR